LQCPNDRTHVIVCIANGVRERLLSLQIRRLPAHTDLDYIERVIERVPALYDSVPLKEKRDIIDRTGINLTLTF
jgi:hypothetical protein